MNMNIISQNLAMKYMTAFNELGWVNLDFGPKSKPLLARLNPRIDTQSELVMVSTYPARRKPWITSIAIDNRAISDISIVITDRRMVLLNRSDDKTEEFYFSDLSTWDRPGYLGITGKLTYKLTTKYNRVVEINIQAGGSGWIAFLAGFSNPIASADALRGSKQVDAFVSFFDSFIQTIYNSSKSFVL
jgi:hypothetical protein